MPMNFYHSFAQYKNDFTRGFWQEISQEDVLSVLNKQRLNEKDLAVLLSPAASNCLEPMAQRAHQLSLQHFGKSIILYTPLYLANYCVNKCVYCTFNFDNKIRRRKLTMKEIAKEADLIARTGLRHILLLTGESRRESSIEYIAQAVSVLKDYFHSIGIEIYPLSQEEYEQLVKAGVDSLTIYQEVYDQEIYRQVHPKGPKRNYQFRLEAAERGCKAGIRSVNIGALLGLNDWRQEAFMTAIHANYLQNKYPEVEVGVSLPRIRPHKGDFTAYVPVEDRELVQILLALRNFLPYVGITISTREEPAFRDNLIPLGVTKMSAGVSTEVGSRSGQDREQTESQFEISDTRTVEEIKKSILTRGYQPIFKDWLAI